MKGIYSALVPRSFYERYTPHVAKELLGKLLVRRIGNSIMVGAIVETEAYRGSDDQASHAYRGMTRRNAVMFGPAGLAYVYFVYGNHHCLNITTEPEGIPGAVLIRAIEPVYGIELMMKNRGKRLPVSQLTNGPGKLTKAMKIDLSLSGVDMTRAGPLFVTEPTEPRAFEVVNTRRIGIKVGLDKPWRFYIKNSRYISKRGKA